ncbi:hypothetical protein VKI21_17545 [Cyanobacterium aponinum UTEX 3222]|uniref:hypothetical protein n=1 Tax=Cyanobacterium aponinum TaxID=379064 RepID=UPI002B4C0424|nr:hypothetical protein [Cyanobacterium aponinum]WRL37710.1 hypothetical protein VKI22_13930 [Cyanobacterium aponinum UTEX 3221]WRL41819.1 hypothetical protein VKI21_17545 [Cyanobacterium aponinum UTEX 3222]
MKKYPNINFEYIEVGKWENLLSQYPSFLLSVYSMLPKNMKGTLSLIGAGPWSEIYCTWIKKKGEVAVDIGSGFDLLDGDLTRPIHHLIETDKKQKFIL